MNDLVYNETVFRIHKLLNKPISLALLSAGFDDVLALSNESVVTTKSGNEVPNFRKFCMAII